MLKRDCPKIFGQSQNNNIVKNGNFTLQRVCEVQNRPN